MRTNKFISIVLLLVLSFNILSLPIFADEIMPRWQNIFSVHINHGLDNDTACCYIRVKAYSGTDKIDNIDIKLYQMVGNALILVASWDDLSTTGDEFAFYEEVDDVIGGYTYRLAITADVHRYGYVEQLDTYGDVAY